MDKVEIRDGVGKRAENIFQSFFFSTPYPFAVALGLPWDWRSGHRARTFIQFIHTTRNFRVIGENTAQLLAKCVYMSCTPSNQPEDQTIMCRFRLMELSYSAEQQGLLFLAHGKPKLTRLVQTFKAAEEKLFRLPGEICQRKAYIHERLNERSDVMCLA